MIQCSRIRQSLAKCVSVLCVCLISSLMLWFSKSVFSALTIDVTENNNLATRVAVAPFGWRQGDLLSEDVAAIIENDFLLSGVLRPVKREQMLSTPTRQSEVSFRDWKILDVSYLLIGNVEKYGGSCTIKYELYNVLKRKRILSGEVKGTVKRLRLLAHYITDAVYQKITTFRGDFATRIMYITVKQLKTRDDKLQKKQSAHYKGAREKVFGRKFLDKSKKGAKKLYQLNDADADGHNPRIIFSSLEPLLSPAWSSDGKQVVYVSFERGKAEIFMQNLETSKRTNLTRNDFIGQTSSPAWSFDGKYIAMSVSRVANGQADIYIMQISTQKYYQITTEFGIDTEPAWLPDGKSILFTSSRSKGVQIYQQMLEYDLDGGVRPKKGSLAKRLTFDGIFNARAKSFPDGRGFVLVHKANSNSRQSVAAQYLYGNRKSLQILSNSMVTDSPSIGPGGRRVIYSKHGFDKERGQLGMASLDGKMKFIIPYYDTNGRILEVREPAWGSFVDK